MLLLVFLLGSQSLVTCSPVWSSLQYHHQNDDGSGSYRYGFQGPHHAKMETRSNGITQGGYSYIDANGVLQSVAYTADAMNGFRVRASNLPQPQENSLLPTIADESTSKASPVETRRSHLGVREGIENSLESLPSNSNGLINNPFLLSNEEAQRIEVPKPTLNYIIKRTSPAFKYVEPSTGPTTFVLPATTSLVLPVPYKMAHSSLHHTQDSLGQYDYSYAGDTSAKSESRSLDGTTRGAYSYIDANGLLQQVHYIADHNGFRVLATNLPEA